VTAKVALQLNDLALRTGNTLCNLLGGDNVEAFIENRLAEVAELVRGVFELGANAVADTAGDPILVSNATYRMV
jgi:hypothetical protein